jgi:hypothetical protein
VTALLIWLRKARLLLGFIVKNIGNQVVWQPSQRVGSEFIVPLLEGLTLQLEHLDHIET